MDTHVGHTLTIWSESKRPAVAPRYVVHRWAAYPWQTKVLHENDPWNHPAAVSESQRIFGPEAVSKPSFKKMRFFGVTSLILLFSRQKKKGRIYRSYAHVQGQPRAQDYWLYWRTMAVCCDVESLMQVSPAKEPKWVDLSLNQGS